MCTLVSDHIVTICVPSQQVEDLLTELVRGVGVDTAILTMNASRCHFQSPTSPVSECGRRTLKY